MKFRWLVLRGLEENFLVDTPYICAVQIRAFSNAKFGRTLHNVRLKHRDVERRLMSLIEWPVSSFLFVLVVYPLKNSVLRPKAKGNQPIKRSQNSLVSTKPALRGFMPLIPPIPSVFRPYSAYFPRFPPSMHSFLNFRIPKT